MSVDEEYQFVNDLPEEYQCSICLSVLNDPHLTTCCGHHFCKECICKVAQANQACPMCKTEGFVAVIDKNVFRKIRALPVRCHFHSKGCGWQGELRGLQEHLDPHQGHCKFIDIVCPKGCGQTLPHSKLDTHLAKECPNRDQQCQYCDETVPYSSMTAHYDNDCTHIPLRCPNGCSELMPRGAIPQHLSACPCQPTDCEFVGFGCSVKFARRDQGKHMQEYFHKHLHMVAECCTALSQTIARKQTEVSRITSQLQHKEKELDQLRNASSLQQQNFDEKLQQQQTQFQEKIERLEQQVMQLTLQVGNQSRLNNLDLQHRVMILETQVPVPPYYFTVSNFALHKQGGTQWTCPSFFSEVGGYKMAIEVSANGEGVGRDTHISVYIRIMHGEYDDMLRWPLRASVTIQLISQSGNEAHYEMTTPQYEWGRVTNGVIGVGWGWDKFIPHHELEFNPVRRTEYLKNDRLNFRVICVDNTF